MKLFRTLFCLIFLLACEKDKMNLDGIEYISRNGGKNYVSVDSVLGLSFTLIRVSGEKKRHSYILKGADQQGREYIRGNYFGSQKEGLFYLQNDNLRLEYEFKKDQIIRMTEITKEGDTSMHYSGIFVDSAVIEEYRNGPNLCLIGGVFCGSFTAIEQPE